MIKIRFSEYVDGNYTGWQDWSEYLYEDPSVSKKAESENPGEAGLIVFDKATLSFYYENGNPVYNAFSGELTDKQRYMFEIYEHKRVKTGNDSDWVKVFEGLADFTTVEWPEFETVISFDVVEKISALSILEAALPRISGNVNPDVNSDPTADSLVFLKKTDSADIMMCYADINDGSEYARSISGPNSIAVVDGTLKSASLANTPNAGAIIKENFLHDQSEDSGYFFLPTAKKIVPIPVKKCNYVNGQYVDAGTTNINFVIYKAISDNLGFYGEGTQFQANVVNARNTEWFKELFHNTGIYLRRPGVTYTYYDKLYLRQIPPSYQGAGYYVLDFNPALGIGGSVSTKTEIVETDYEIYAMDGIKIIEVLIKQQWPDIQVLNRTGQDNYPIPLEFFNQLMDENPFGEHPLDALKTIADSMRCYIFTDRLGRFVIQKKNALGDNGTTRNLGSTLKVDGTKRFCWDKLADAIEIKVKSWRMGTNNEYLEGYAYLSKNPNIQPRNKITKEILAGNSTDITQETLDAYALQIANEYMLFYGQRHFAYPVTLDLDDNTIEWELLDNIVINGVKYFFDNIDLNLSEKTIDLELVSVESFNYDLRQVVIPLSEQAYIASSSGKYSSSTSSFYGSGNPYLWNGGLEGLDPELGRQSLGLGNVLSDLAGKEPAIPAGTDAQYWRGDKTWQNFNTAARSAVSASAPLSFNSGTGVFSLAYSDNLKITSGQLDTVQGIKTSNTPWWTRLGVGGAPDAVLPLKVTGNAKITGNLTIDGDIYIGGLINEVNVNEMYIADRNISLNRNGDNTTAVGGGIILNGTANSALATILYDGARWAFSKEVKLSGTGTHEIYGDLKQIGTKSFYNNYTSGWAGSGFKVGLDAQGNSFLEIDNINVRKTLSAYEFLLKQISAVNGFEFISSSARVENAWYDGDLGNYYITFEDPTSSNMCPFAVGDMVICQTYKPDGATIIRRAEATVWEVSGSTCMVVYNYGQAQKGDVLVRIGNEYEPARQNSIYLAADDQNSPFIDIITGVDSWAAWNSTSKTKARFGNLSGITDPLLNPSGYGLYADNVFIKGRLAGSTVSGTTTKTVVMDSSGPVFFASLRNTARSADNLDVYVGSFFGGSHVGILMQAADAAGVNKELFRLSKQISNGAITAKIGPWNFDDAKFSNGDVRIEASAALKGIAISASGVDIARFGDFVNASETYGSESLAFSSNFYNGVEVIHFGYNAVGNPTTIYPNEGNGAYYSGARFQIYKDLPIASVKGRNIQISFSIAEYEYIAAEGELVKVFAYVNTDQGDFGLTQVNPSSYTLTGAAKVYSTKSISCIIPSDATYAKLCLRGIRTNYYNTNPTAGIDIKDLTLSRYNKTIIEVNKSGFKMFSGPNSRIVMNDSEVNLNVSKLSTNNRLDIGDWTFITETYLDGSNNISSRLRLKYKGQNKGWFNSETGAYQTT